MKTLEMNFSDGKQSFIHAISTTNRAHSNLDIRDQHLQRHSLFTPTELYASQYEDFTDTSQTPLPSQESSPYTEST